MRRAWLRTFAGFLALAGAAGCQLVMGVEDFQGGGGAAASAVKCGKPQGHGGANMVSQARADGTCVWLDVTEVTAADYDVFRAAHPGNPGQPAPCELNKSYELDVLCLAKPAGHPVGAPAGKQPVVCVDWCDAEAFCGSVGKRLCKGDFLSYSASAKSEWTAACAHGGSQGFPYANNYSAQACNGGCLTQPCSSKEAGALLTCKADCGALDLSGNVSEWVNECNGNTGATDKCLVRGGGATTPQEGLTCQSGQAVNRLDSGELRGFRCCADPI